MIFRFAATTVFSRNPPCTRQGPGRDDRNRSGRIQPRVQRPLGFTRLGSGFAGGPPTAQPAQVLKWLLESIIVRGGNSAFFEGPLDYSLDRSRRGKRAVRAGTRLPERHDPFHPGPARLIPGLGRSGVVCRFGTYPLGLPRLEGEVVRRGHAGAGFLWIRGMDRPEVLYGHA